MIVEHETSSCITYLLLIPQLCVILLSPFSYSLSRLLILQNCKGLYSARDICW